MIEFSTFLGVLGIIIGAIWIGIGLKAGETFYEFIIRDWWVKTLSRFKRWIEHFRSAPGKVGNIISERIDKDRDRIS